MSAPRSFHPLRRPRSRAPLAVLLTALALAATGCADRHSIEVGAIPDDYRTRHPIVVDEDEALLLLPITGSDLRLSIADKGRVEDFGAQFRSARSASIRVLLPSGSANEHAAGLVSRDVVAALKRAGVPGTVILVQPYRADGQAGAVPIRLSFATLAAKTAPCGRWPEDLGNTNDNKNYFNFGCASQQNLAAQVADPRDLVTPRGRSPVDAARRTNMLEKYRLGQETASAPLLGEVDYQW